MGTIRDMYEYLSVGTVILLALFVVLVGFLVLAFVSPIAVVPAGNVSVMDTFGVVEPNVAHGGFHFKFPFTRFVNMSYKTQEMKESASVPSIEGLIVGLDISLLYKIEPDKAPELYRTVGTNYDEIIIQPMLRSTIREVTAKYEAKALYTQGRDVVSRDIYALLEPKFAERGIVLEQVLLRDLTLPKTVSDAIEVKLKSEQEAEQYKFILQKEEQEAERKRLEAAGIADSQKIINETLTTEYLQFLWVNKLNENPNVVYVPIGNGGLPLIKET